MAAIPPESAQEHERREREGHGTRTGAGESARLKAYLVWEPSQENPNGLQVASDSPDLASAILANGLPWAIRVSDGSRTAAFFSSDELVDRAESRGVVQAAESLQEVTQTGDPGHFACPAMRSAAVAVSELWRKANAS